MDNAIMKGAPDARNSGLPSYAPPTIIIVSDASALQAMVTEAVRLALADRPTGAALEPDGLHRKADAARMLGVSTATLDRAVREGLPYVTIGNGKRFDLTACREWFAARGQKPTTQKASTKPDAETVDIIEKSGLRLVAGAR